MEKWIDCEVQRVAHADEHGEIFSRKAIKSMAGKSVSISHGFDRSKPLLGVASTYVNNRGNLGAKLNLNTEGLRMLDRKHFAAIGGICKKAAKLGSGPLSVQEIDLLEISICMKHADPTIPPIGEANHGGK